MWNALDNSTAPGPATRHDLGRSNVSMHMNSAYNLLSDNNFNELIVAEESKKGYLDVFGGRRIILENVNHCANPSGGFASVSSVSNQNFGKSELACVQTDIAGTSQNSLSTQENRSFPANCLQHPINALSANSQVLGVNFPIETKGNSSQNIIEREPSSTSTSAVIAIPRLPYSQHFTYNVMGHSEVNNSHFAVNTAGSSGNSHGNCTSKGEINTQFFGRGPMHELICGNVNTPRNVHNQGPVSTEHASESAKSNNMVDVARSLNDLLHQTNYIINSVVAAERSDTCIPVKNEIKCSNDISATMPVDACHQDSLRFGHSTSIISSQVLSGINNLPIKTNNQDLQSNKAIHKDEICHNALDLCGSLPNVQPGPLEKQLKSALDGERKVTNGSTTMIIAGKLWDGTIQLSTTTTVLAVAFFKSGEKSLDVNWPNFIEVKGKVRLEAFEKFIQELPRSRSRALMVTSLCWKSGTPVTGLTSIKEVAKTYKDGRRVGFAHLCPGTDLYVCPRSETIITILAKYGFFKGMDVVEEDQDSLIGCVVWRRNSNSNLASKESDSKKTPAEKVMNSPSSSILQTAPVEAKDSENKPATMPKMDPEIVSTSQTSALSLPCMSRSAIPPQVTPSTMILASKSLEVPPESNSMRAHQSIPILSQSSSNNYFMTPLRTYTEQILGTEAPVYYATAAKKPRLDVSDRHSSLEAVQLSQKTQIGSKCADEDDLPEFDFDAACGAATSEKHITWSNQQQDVSAVEGIKYPSSREHGDLSKLAPMQSLFPALPAQINPDSAQVKAREPEVLVKQQAIHSKRAIWDDDDMPEWCPPDLDHQNQHLQQRPELWQPHSLQPPVSLPCQLPEPDPQPRPLSSPQQSPLLLYRPTLIDHQPGLPLPPLLQLPSSSSLPTHGLLSSISHQTSNVMSLAPFMSNATDHNRRVNGRETISYTSLSIQPLSPSRPYLEPRHSPGYNTGTLGRLYSGFDRKDDKMLSLVNRNESSKGPYASHLHGVQSPRKKSSESTRRRPTGFDVLPDDSRSVSTHRTRRRRSLFDVKPDSSYSNGKP